MNEELDELKKILDDDEMVQISIKPRKKRFVLINALAGIIGVLIFGGIFLLIGILGLVGVIAFDSDGVKNIGAPLGFIIFGSLPLIFITINTIGLSVRYKRCVYVVTNKRLIIRSGFVGVDYKSLELKDVISINVRVDFLDKLVKPNTGTLYFASAANPVVVDKNNKDSVFAFANIENPYEEYKKIKGYLPEK